MVLRQVLIGVGGGAALAMLALFLTIPRATVEAALPQQLLPWVAGSRWEEEPPGELAHAARSDRSRRGQALAMLPSGNGKIAAESGLSASESNLDVAGVRVAALGDSALTSSSASSPDSSPESQPQEPLEAREPNPEELDPELYLGALSKQTIIRREPNLDSPIIGFARTGALLRRAAVPAGHKGCKAGWYRIEPDGYVCVGQAATLDPEHPILQLASYQPDRSLALPYPYGTSRYPTPPLYTRIPNRTQQEIAEQDLAGHLKKNFGSLWAEQADTPAPSLLADGARIPRPYGYPVLEHDFMTGRALGSSAFAFIDLFESEGRRWGLTADLSLLPLDRLVPVEESDFFGRVLEEGRGLPLAFVRARSEHYYERTEQDGILRPTRAIAYREAFHLTGKKERVFGTTFLETRQGGYIKEQERLVVIEERESMPKWAHGDRSWLEISVLEQTLVAYRGATPIFATLVSTGKDGLGDPETTHSTVQGVFLIHTKHVTSTMSGDEADDEFDLRDVPYVQYFHGGYALHAAFWHDSFGAPRSHGCINLSPADARHLFSVTEPAVPLRWHSALSRHGTLVYVHP